MIKSKLKCLVILFTLAFSILNLPPEKLFPVVKATYVEGEIKIDTIWTLLDSPFIVCQNVTIRKGVTLTIEPGVEVRFGGGPFTIIVNGRLIAKGTEEKPIKFTSNKENPEAGDWAAILFNGTGQPPSVLENCVVEYGIDGITVNDGNVTIRKSIIQFNLKNGIALSNGNVTVEQCIVQNNGEGGIKVSGGNITIQNNNITLNSKGMLLTGNLTGSSVLITRNHIFNNSDSGIFLEMEASSDNIYIRNNTVFSNRYGFHISTDTPTFITRNYIYNNYYGAFYRRGNHTIRFNNICNNTVGVDASPDARVNATQNYWGDRSGPHHESLNPRGKGNPVGGNGVNIDFIFFLTAPIDHKNSPPTAVLWADKNTVALNQMVTFVGSGSYDDGRVDQYFFDFGNGQESNWTTLSMFFYTYNSSGSYNVSLRVMDDFGDVSNVTSLTVHVVDNLPSLDVSMNLSSYTVDYNTPITATVYVSFNGTPIESANVNLFAVAKGFSTNLTNSTDSSGRCILTFSAPRVMDVTHLRVMVRASKEGYADGSGYEYVMVLPPLNVNVTTEREAFYSEELVVLTVGVTDAYGEPVENAVLSLLVGNQTIEGSTDTTGSATLNFTAPVVHDPTNLTVYVLAFKELYAKGFCTFQIEVHPRKLTVDVYPETPEIRSEELTRLFVSVRWMDNPVPEAEVHLVSNASDYITLSPTSGTTDLNGVLEVTLTAHQVTTNLTVMLGATAAKEGYISGENWTYVHIRPKILTVSVNVNREILVTDEEVKVDVHVECEGVPEESVKVTLYLNVSAFTPLTAFTNAGGNAAFTFNVVVPHDMIVNMTVKAQKEGYVEGCHTITLRARPANLTVNVGIFSSIVKPGEHAKIYVYVGRGNQPLANASVTATPSHGSLTSVKTYTNDLGFCEVPIYIPVGTEPSYVYVTVNVSKYGYNSVEKPNCVYFQIVSEAAFPWFTLLLVLIPVALLVVFVVLVKLGVIVVSFGEEKESE